MLKLVLLGLITMRPCLVPALMISLGGRNGVSLLHRFSLWLKPRQGLIGLKVFFSMAIDWVVSGLHSNYSVIYDQASRIIQASRILMARAAITAMVIREMPLSTIINTMARGVRGTAPVGLKAVALQ